MDITEQMNRSRSPSVS